MKAGLFLAVALCLASPAWAFVARAKSVQDGDSLTVRCDDNTLLNVRLYGIDAPELKQAYGLHAKKLLASLALRQTLDVQALDTDRYGRIVALVRLKDGTLLNEVMVAEGLAWVYDQYCQEYLCPRLRALEAQARRERHGLWAAAAPMRPSDWRREHKAEEWRQAPARVMERLDKSLNKVLRCSGLFLKGPSAPLTLSRADFGPGLYRMSTLPGPKRGSLLAREQNSSLENRPSARPSRPGIPLEQDAGPG